MTERDGQATEKARPRRGRGGLWLVLALALIALLAGVVTLGLTGRVIPAPDWIVRKIEERANLALAGQITARIGGVDLLVDGSFVPHVRLSEVTVFSARGARIALLPDVRATLHGGPILSGRIEPRILTISGARVALLRLPDGSLDVAMTDRGQEITRALSPTELLGEIDATFSLPGLKDLERIDVFGLGLRFEDSRSDQVWNVSDAWLALKQDPERLSIDMGLALAEEGRAPARARLGFSSVKGSPEARIEAQVSDVSARDLAAQSPALAWLAALDAPISGAIRSDVGADGTLSSLNATLEIGAGALKPTEETAPVGFDAVRLEMAYDPPTGQIAFSDIAVDSRSLRARAEAKAWLGEFDGGLPKSLVAQVRMTDLKLDPEGLFADPIVFSQSALDFRMRLDPFRLEIGQFVLIDRGQRITARGNATAEAEGWAVSADLHVDEIESSRLLALWPTSAVPKTRAWLGENVATSALFDARAALRVRPGEEPHFSLGYEYRDTEVRIVKTLPPVQQGAGYATIEGNTYTLVVDRGQVTAPAGGEVDVSGTVLSIPDIRVVPPPARITLRTKSTITAALSLLDQPPFQFLTKAGKPVEIAGGHAEVEAILDLPLAEKLQTKDIAYRVRAKLTDVHSDKIAPGRMLSADALDLTADQGEMQVSGPVAISGVPIDIVWRQSFDKSEKGKSSATGRLTLSERFLDAFSVGLPKGSVSGAAPADFTLDLAEGAPAEFNLTSALKGAALSIPALGWSKPASVPAEFSMRGRLGEPAEIDAISLSAPGLSVSGDITLDKGGGLNVARFGKAKVGDWFEGAAELTGRGKGRPVAVAVTSGSADLRRMDLGGGGSGGGPLTVTLDRLRVTQAITLEAFRGSFTTSGGLAGDFTTRINGKARLRGEVVPFRGRSAFRLTSENAGAALRSADIFRRAQGGAMNLTLTPVAEPGQYDGTFLIQNARVTGTPALAELLDAISVVGLLSQLNGPGLAFTNISGEFRLTPRAVEIRKGAAVGPSMGISAAGVYDTAAGRIDLQGTISPIYLLNGIGQIFTRKGEGFFGFNYRMTGSVDQPDVRVNPLSILTPGMFREIFRSEPPKISQ
ncbi:MAG: AsmA-like C-terminal region-containing protein [Paracoccaceae bacterium]